MLNLEPEDYLVNLVDTPEDPDPVPGDGDSHGQQVGVVEQQELLQAAENWAEHNPMIGTRGVRLGVIKPGLYAMQARALLSAVELVVG